MKMKYTPRSMRTFNFDNMVKTTKKNGFFNKEIAKAVRKEGVVSVAIIKPLRGTFTFQGETRNNLAEVVSIAKANGYSAYKLGARSRVTIKIK